MNRHDTACTTNPDQWFPALVYGGDRVSPRRNERNEKIVAETREALAFCWSCPVREPCLAIGMEEENLEWGIWGGEMPGQRLFKAGKKMSVAEARLMTMLDIEPQYPAKDGIRDERGKFVKGHKANTKKRREQYERRKQLEEIMGVTE